MVERTTDFEDPSRFKSLELDFLAPVVPKATKVVEVKETMSFDVEKVVLKMFAQGVPLDSIADCVNVSYETVSNTVSSARSQALLKDMIDPDDEDQIRGILTAARVDTIMTLVRQRDTGDTSAARIAAGKELNDMLSRMGTPKTKSKLPPHEAYKVAMDKINNLMKQP